MIVISRTENKISVKGHAGYAPQGYDIVCSAVSALTQNLIHSIWELTNDLIKCDVSPGMVEIKFGNLSERSKLLIDSFFVGISKVAEEYPDNVKLTER